MMLRGLVIPLIVLVLSCGRPPTGPGLLEFAGQVMGTTYLVKVVQLPPRCGRAEFATAIDGVLRDVDRLMSTYRADSEVRRFNAHRSTGWFALDQATVAVLTEAQRISRLTEGAFDVTVGPLTDLWGFGPTPRVGTPSPDEVTSVMSHVGWTLLEVRAQPPAARKRLASVEIDLSAIAKGFAIDRVVTLLESRGVRDFLVELGGELAARGSLGDRAWTIGIEGQEPGGETLLLGDAAVATSGGAGNYLEWEGRRFVHILDPRTGQPIDCGLKAATVVHPSAMTADALATAMMVLGTERGLGLARQEGIAVLLDRESASPDRKRLSPEMERIRVGRIPVDAAGDHDGFLVWLAGFVVMSGTGFILMARSGRDRRRKCDLACLEHELTCQGRPSSGERVP